MVVRAWVPGTRIRMVHVNWDRMYRDVVRWKTMTDRDAWFDGLDSEIFIQPKDKYTYLRPSEPIDIGMPFNNVSKWNYIMVDNPPMEGDVARRLYYFITDRQYLSPQTTRITVQLDVWTTFAPTTTWGLSFVDRGHIGLANENATDDPASLRTYQSVQEDLDVGDTLAVSSQHAWGLFNEKLDTEDPSVSPGVMMVVICAADLTADPGSADDSPNQKTAFPSTPDHLVSGATVMAMDLNNWWTFMINIRQYSWISRNIQAIYAVPKGFGTWNESKELKMNSKFGTFPTYDVSYTQSGTEFKKVNAIDEIEAKIPERYRIVKKLLTYPYSVIEMSGVDGSPVFLKPQLLGDRTAHINMVGNMLQPFNRLGFYIAGYADNGAGATQIKAPTPSGPDNSSVMMYYGDTLDVAVWFDNWPQFSILNDMYINYLANTAYTRKYAYESAGWGLQKSTAALELQRDVTSKQMATADANNQIQNGVIDKSRVANLATGALGILGTAASGNVGGAISQGVGMGASMYKGVVAQNASNAQFNNNQNQQAYALDANQKYGAMAAQGDYQNAIHGINAQVQQAQLTPPSTSGQMGGEGMMMAIGAITLRWQAKTMTEGVMNVVGDYFLRYGIAIHRFIQVPSDLVCMSHFAYWKFTEAYIVDSEGDEQIRDTLRGIMEKGVTVWDRPEDIGRTSLYDNKPLKGWSY